MEIKYFAALLLPLTLHLLCISGQGVDLTLQPETFGTNVVLASLQRIQLAGIFPSDNRLLRRIAYVETRDGLDADTYRLGYNGGIWQVDEAIFNMTQDTGTHPELLEYFQQILFAFGIDWPTSTWADLRRPLFSALAARLYFTIVDEDIPMAGDVRGQGEYWKSNYNSNPNDTILDFIERVNEFELEECDTRGLDLVFVLDSSGSVGETNFDLTKEFAANVTRIFTIGPRDTQVGAIAFSGFANISFLLNTFGNQTGVLRGIQEIRYFDIPGNGNPSTNTADALTALRQVVFTVEAGARSESAAIPRVAVVVTDGRSNVNQSQTIPTAQAVHADGITVFAIGVGNRINMDELNAIASRPNLVALLSDFNVEEFQSLQRTLSIEACRVPAPVDIEQSIDDNLDGGEFSFFQFILPTEGMTIRLSVQQGAMALYASTDIQNPNSAFYNYMIETSGTADVYIDPSAFGIDSSIDPAKRQSVNMFTNTTLYVSIEGLGDSNRFMMETTFGDTSMPSSEVGVHPLYYTVAPLIIMALAHVLF